MALVDKLKNELARRIQQDMLPLGRWNPNTWFKTTFGDFYGKGAGQLPIIHRVVGECVDNLLRPNWQMTVAAWQGLQRSTDATDTPESALPDMVRAALDVDPRQFAYFRADAPEPKLRPVKRKAKKKTAVTVKPRKRKGQEGE